MTSLVVTIKDLSEKEIAAFRKLLIQQDYDFTCVELNNTSEEINSVDTSEIPEWTEETFDKAVKGRFFDTEKRTWEEFREHGLLWYVNRSLHLFGWALKFQIENDKVTAVYPARCKFRGFTEELETDGFKKLTKHLADNMDTLLIDVKD